MKKILVAAFSFLLLFSANRSFAALTLSVGPADGSSNLKFDRIAQGLENRKEVRVRVSSAGGRYDVYQSVLGSLVNEKGDALNLQAIQTTTMNNSNSAGTLYLQNADRLSQSEQLLYSSGQGGEDDSFIISYVVDPAAIGGVGNFFGKILFTVRSRVNGSQEQAFVNVFVESVSEWKVSVSGGRIPGMIQIKDADTSEKTADFVKIAFSGNAGQDVRIYQELNAMPQSATSDEMPGDALRFSVTGENPENIRVSGAMPVGLSRTLVYSGKSPEDHVAVYFWTNPEKIVEVNAGSYAGKVKYVVQTDNSSEEFLMDLQCDIQPVFNMDVTLPPEGVSFPNVLPTNPPKEKEVMVTVRSNLHRPYQVLQDLQSPMSNEKGSEVEKGYFTVKVEVPSGEKGQSKFADFMPIQTGEYPIFSSDGKGSPATFKVVYRLQGYPQLSSGNYSAPIRFSLNQN